MSKLNNPNIEKKIEALSGGAQLAIVLCANSFRFGGNWGFIRKERKDFRDQLETLKQERPNVRAIPVTNGALILSNENFLAHNVNAVVPNAINGSFVDMANKRKADEKARFQKFIENIAKGKSSYVKSAKGYYELTLGIFSVNDTNHIRINGKDFPAYKLTLMEALDYANQLASTGKQVYARAVKEDGTEVFDKVFNLAGNSKGQQALYRGLEIADSETGLFLTLRLV